MRLFRRKKQRKGSIFALAMLDIVSNAMAGVAILFFIHVALQLQEPPPVPIRGRLVFELEFTSDLDTEAPVIFMEYQNKRNKKTNWQLFDEEIDSRFSKFQFTEAPEAQIRLERVVLQDAINPNKWYVHLIDPFEGDYTIGLVYKDHEKFLRRSVPHKVFGKSYFELKEGSKEYESKISTADLNSPTNFHQFQATVSEDLFTEN